MNPSVPWAFEPGTAGGLEPVQESNQAGESNPARGFPGGHDEDENKAEKGHVIR